MYCFVVLCIVLLFYVLFVVVLCIVCFVLFYVLFVCKCVLPPGDNPIAVNKYIISYQYRNTEIKTNVQYPHNCSSAGYRVSPSAVV